MIRPASFLLPGTSLATRHELTPKIAFLIVAVLAAAWSIPLLWVALAAFRPQLFGGEGMASLTPDFIPTIDNLKEAWSSADFPQYYVNTFLITAGILTVQLITITLAGYAFARLSFPGKRVLFYLFLLQLMLAPVVLIVPNLTMVVRLGLYDTLMGVMAPNLASAFGTFLMRQTFAAIPQDLEDAALIDGASWWRRIWHIYVPLSAPAFIAFAVVSVTAHWNDFLWPLMVINDPAKRPVTVGLASFTSGAEGAQAWGVVAAGTLLVIAPLIAAFLVFQRRFLNSFITSGIK